MKLVKSLILITVIGVIEFGNNVHPQPLDSLLLLVVEQNPELSTLHRNYEAQLSKVDQVGQLPDPSLGAGIPVLRPETRLGPQLIMVGASQMFPWFGTLKSKEEVVISMAKSKFERIAALKLDLFFKVKQQYYTAYFLDEKQRVIENSLSLYKSLEHLALAKVESGKAKISDVLRVQLMIEQLDRTLEMLENDRLAADAEINQLTNRSWDKTTAVIGISQSVIALNFDTAAIIKKVTEHHPIIRALNYKEEASINAQIANRKLNSPKFSMGVDYSLVGQRTDANPLNNGRDILVPKVMISLPIYRKSYKAKQREEVLTQEEIMFQKEAFVDKTMSRLLQLKTMYDNSLIEIKLHLSQIELTEKTIDILIAAYSSDGIGFDELLQVENQLLQHEIGLIKAYYGMLMAIAKIERLTDY